MHADDSIPAAADSNSDLRASASYRIQRAWRKYKRSNDWGNDQTKIWRDSSEKSLLNNRLSQAIELGKLLSAGSLRSKSSAQLLGVNHWIEAADPQHRYGTRLAPYYQAWLKSGTNQNFFRWLDKGEGKSLDLAQEGHPREKLLSSKVQYLTGAGKNDYQIDFRNGVLYWLSSGELVNACGTHTCALDLRFRFFGRPMKYIFVIDLHDRLYVGKKVKGRFHHSSFLGARPVRSAGSIIIKKGKLLAVNASSGHYKPNDAAFGKSLQMLEEKYGVKLSSYIQVYSFARKCCCGRVQIPRALEDLLCCRRRARVHPAPQT